METKPQTFPHKKQRCVLPTPRMPRIAESGERAAMTPIRRPALRPGDGAEQAIAVPAGRCFSRPVEHAVASCSMSDPVRQAAEGRPRVGTARGGTVAKRGDDNNCELIGLQRLDRSPKLCQFNKAKSTFNQIKIRPSLSKIKKQILLKKSRAISNNTTMCFLLRIMCFSVDVLSVGGATAA